MARQRHIIASCAVGVFMTLAAQFAQAAESTVAAESINACQKSITDDLAQDLTFKQRGWITVEDDRLARFAKIRSEARVAQALVMGAESADNIDALYDDYAQASQTEAEQDNDKTDRYFFRNLRDRGWFAELYFEKPNHWVCTVYGTDARAGESFVKEMASGLGQLDDPEAAGLDKMPDADTLKALSRGGVPADKPGAQLTYVGHYNLNDKPFGCHSVQAVALSPKWLSDATDRDVEGVFLLTIDVDFSAANPEPSSKNVLTGGC